jgi:hypothetical protein
VIEVTVTAPDSTSVKWMGRQATKRFDGGSRMLTVLLGPESVRGFAILVHERDDGGDDVWMYLPPVRRVRKMVYLGGAQSFLGTDFSYGDFGFFATDDRVLAIGGKAQRGGVAATALQEKSENGGPYSKVVTWVADETRLPIERQYFDAAGELWKTAFFGVVEVIGGHPTALRVRMENRQEGGSSEIAMSDVRYDVPLADDLFDATKLAEAADRMPR